MSRAPRVRERFSWVDLLVHVYGTRGGDADWLQGVLELLQPRLDRGLGIYGYFDDVEAESIAFDAVRFQSCETNARDHVRDSLCRFSHDPAVREVVMSHPAGTSSSIAGRDDWTAICETIFRGEVRDSIGIAGYNPNGFGVCITALAREQCTLGPAELRFWQRISAHLASGVRLRRSIGSLGGPALGNAPAVFDDVGRLQHVGEAQADSATWRSVESALRATADRTRVEDDGLALWTALVRGEWSLVTHFDSDGKRFYVAWPNAPILSEDRRLTQRELQTVAFASLGHPNKLIAYSLGATEPTVSGHLRAAAAKLGVSSRVELIQLAKALARRHVDSVPCTSSATTRRELLPRGRPSLSNK